MEKSPEQTFNLYNIYIFKKTMGACNYLVSLFSGTRTAGEEGSHWQTEEKRKEETKNVFMI